MKSIKTIKIIDLLNKIANDVLEDIKFRYKGDYFKYYKSNHQIDRYEDNTYRTVAYYNDDMFNHLNLNDEVEIIEEDKKIKKIIGSAEYNKNYSFDEHMKRIAHNFDVTQNKINEIIDRLGELEKGNTNE